MNGILPSQEVSAQDKSIDYFVAILRAELLRVKDTWPVLAPRIGVNKLWLGRFVKGQIQYPPLPVFLKMSKSLGFVIRIEPGSHFLEEVTATASMVGLESFKRRQHEVRNPNPTAKRRKL